MLRKLLAYIRQHDMLHPGDRLGVAVSGGADSVALLRALLELRRDLGIVLSVVHIHHGIRGAHADSDADFVASLAHQHGLDLHLHRADVPAFARENRLSLEAAGRKVRYDCFAELVSSGALQKIATAHTFDDQAETVLLRILRGAGLAGIAGIHPSLTPPGATAPTVIRPLLTVSRNEIIDYLNSLHQPWREDLSNADLRHARNRVRHELLPLLERDYNPGVRDALNNLADIARADTACLADLSAPALSSLADFAARELRANDLLSLPLALQRQVLIAAASRFCDLRLSFHDVEDLRRVAAGTTSAVQLDSGCRVERVRTSHGPALRFTPAAAAERTSPSPYEYPLAIPGKVFISQLNATVEVTLVSSTNFGAGYNPAALLDRTRLAESLVLRNWRPGDRFHPLHTRSLEKLKRLFQEKKIPPEERPSWPVLVSGLEIVWVRGFPVSAEYAAHSGSESAVAVQYCPADKPRDSVER